MPCTLCGSSILSSINSTCDSCSLQSKSGGQDRGRASSCPQNVVASGSGYHFFHRNKERFRKINSDLTLLQCHSILIHCESAANQQSFAQEAVTQSFFFLSGRLCHSSCDQNKGLPIVPCIGMSQSMSSFSQGHIIGRLNT